MGDPKRQHKKYIRPKKLSEGLIAEERAIVETYGLKNKREIWKAESQINRIREQAKKLILDSESQPAFFNRLMKIGLIKSNSTIDDVLALTKEKMLDRRFQTVVFKKGLAKTIKEARQLITHKKICIDGKIVDIPGYIIKINEETTVTKK